MLAAPVASYAQNTFKAGFRSFSYSHIIKEYTFLCTPTDSMNLTPIDSAITYIANDSAATMFECYKKREDATFKTLCYFNKKQLTKKEEYKNEQLIETNEWKYDDKNRKTAHTKTNHLNNNNYKKLYEYTTDKKTGENVVAESSWFNGRIEFYTKQYMDSKGQMTKEVRLNDNNKDIVHVETFAYGANGKVRERTVYFPEFKVTKKFPEPAGDIPAKCFALMACGTIDKPNQQNKQIYIKKVLKRNNKAISEPGCTDFEYTLTNNTNCTITVTPAKGKNLNVKFKLKEKV